MELDNTLTIGQVAQSLGCNTSLLRFYEKEFDLPVPRTSGNRRLYSQREIDSFRYINKLKAGGYNNAQIKAVLKSGRLDRVESFSEVIKKEEPDKKEEPKPISQESFDELIEENVLKDPFILRQAPNAEPVNNADLVAIFSSIAALRDEINTLKNAETAKDIAELLEENARLKAKIKEKTYELVDARERIQELTLKSQKKSLFKRQS